MGAFNLLTLPCHGLLWCILYTSFLFPFRCNAVGPYLGHRFVSTSVLLPKQSVSIENKASGSFVHELFNPKHQRWYHPVRNTIKELVTGSVRRTSHRYLQHAIYWLTAIDTVISVILNEYSNLSFPGTYLVTANEKQGVVREVYSKLFYFARMRPRLLYSLGALVRALSLCTPLRYLLDPAVGVGAGIHFFAHLTGSRWVKPLVLGWATTKAFWTWLGAKPVDRAYIPITLSIHEWEDKRGKKTSKVDRCDKQ